MTNNGDQTNAGGDQAIRIAITPTWEAIAKISIEALVNGTEGGQRMAREEIIDLGIKLDDAKEIIEGANPENYKKQLTRINNQVRHIDQLETMIDRMKENFGKEAEDDLKYIRKLESKVEALKDDFDKGQDYIADLENQIKEKDKAIAELVDRVDKLGKTNDKLRDERDEWKRNGERITGLKACIKDLENTLAFKNQTIVNLNGAKADLQKYWDERNCLQPGLPGIKHEDPIHDKILDLILDSEVAKRNKLTEDAMDLVGVRELMVYTINQQIKYNETHGEDTSIDEQVANNQPYREGDE